MIKKDGTVLFEDSGEKKDEAADGGSEQTAGAASKFIKGRPEIDRPVLKDLLIASLPADTIHWGSKVISLTPAPASKQWVIELDDGSHPAPFDLVVGADGAWSRTRALLSDQQPLYSGITALDVWIQKVDEVAPEVSGFVGMGNCFLFEKDRALLFQRNGEGRGAAARCYTCVKTNTQTAPSSRELMGLENEGPEIDWADAQMREKFVEKYFSDWFPEVKRILLSLTDDPVLRPLWMLPVGFTWESRPGVTLVGDAAHLMTPFAGVGVNVALMDALELARGIVACVETGGVDGDSLATMLQHYEEGMFSRSKKEAAKTESAMHIHFSEGGGERMLEIISRASQPEDLVFD